MSTSKTILAVDDESHILHVVSLKLRNAGFNVITANDAEDAFDLAMTSGCSFGVGGCGACGGATIDLVITDFQMPGISGLELARKLHAEPGKSDLPVMLLTAHGLALEQVDLRRAGINVCLSKPFSPRDLLAKVDELLARHKRPPPSPKCAMICSEEVAP
ncbi:MAG: response regulator transcription factor [Phycisphaerales bacterium]|nr:response regulator transcription factor [Phycisphaerales bacterium]